MTHSRKLKHLQVADLKLSKSQLVRLLEIDTELLSIFSHDVLRGVSTIRNWIFIIKMRLEKINNQMANPSQGNIQNTLDEFKEELNRMDESCVITVNNIDILNRFHADDLVQILVSKPINIVEEIIHSYPHVHIEISKQSLKSLEIIYPENILGGVLHEVIRNAVRYGDSSAEILLEWGITGSSFHCKIHDSGKGISSSLGTSFLPFSDISAALSDRRNDSGLAIINRIILRSGGSLLFKRSRILGGTLVFFELPIYGYYEKGQVHDLTQQ